MFTKHLLAAAIAVVAFTGPANAADVIKFGSLRVPHQLFVGMEKGFFAEENIQLESIIFKSGAEIAPAIATGHVDAAVTTSGAALFNAMARGADVVIVAEAASLEPNAPGGDPTAIIARADLVDSGAIKSGADLKGKTIAVTAPGQVLDIIVNTFLAKNGLKASDVKMIGMPFPDMVPAMSNGAIDAAIVIDPFRSMLVKSGKAKVLAEASEVVPNASQAFIVLSRALVAKRDLAERFVRAYVKTNQFVRKALPTKEGRAEIAAIYQKHVPVKDASAYERIALGTASADAKVNVDGEYGLKWQLQQLVERGLIQGDPQLDKHLDQSLLPSAKAQ